MVAMEQLEFMEPWDYRTNVGNGALGGHGAYGVMGPMDLFMEPAAIEPMKVLVILELGVFRRSGLMAALRAVRNYRLEPTPVELLG